MGKTTTFLMKLSFCCKQIMGILSFFFSFHFCHKIKMRTEEFQFKELSLAPARRKDITLSIHRKSCYTIFHQLRFVLFSFSFFFSKYISETQFCSPEMSLFLHGDAPTLSTDFIITSLVCGCAPYWFLTCMGWKKI